MIFLATSMTLLLPLLHCCHTVGDDEEDDVADGVGAVVVHAEVPLHESSPVVPSSPYSVLTGCLSVEVMVTAVVVLEMISCHLACCCYHCTPALLLPLNLSLADVPAGGPNMMVTVAVEMEMTSCCSLHCTLVCSLLPLLEFQL